MGAFFRRFSGKKIDKPWESIVSNTAGVRINKAFFTGSLQVGGTVLGNVTQPSNNELRVKRLSRIPRRAQILAATAFCTDRKIEPVFPREVLNTPCTQEILLRIDVVKGKDSTPTCLLYTSPSPRD